MRVHREVRGCCGAGSPGSAPTSRLGRTQRAASVHSRGRCAAAASAPGPGRGAWRPAVLRKLGRGPSGAGEGARGHLRPERQHWHRPNPPRRLRPARRRGQSGCAELEAGGASCGRRQSSAGSRGQAGFVTARASRPGLRLPRSRTHARTALHHSLTHARSPRVRNRPVPRGVAGWGAPAGAARHLRPPGGKRRRPRTPPSPLPAAARPQSPSPKRAGKPGAPQPGPSKPDAASPRPAPGAGKSGGGAAVHRRAAASETQGAEV